MNKYSCLVLISIFSFSIAVLRAQVPELDWPIETVSGGHGFTEGASLAPDGKIYFSDMDNQKILYYDPISGSTEIWQQRSGKSNGLYINNNQLYACEAVGRSVVRYDLNKGPGSRKVLSSTFEGDSLGCPNDITIIGDHLYFSEFWIPAFHQNTGANREIFKNRVYALSLEDGKTDSLAFTFEMANGIASSQDGNELYVGDIGANTLYRAHVKKGKVKLMTQLVDLHQIGKNGPDGMAVAGDGRIFLALYRTNQLLVLDHDGNALGYLPTGPLTSNCCFAADGKTLYITADQKLKRVVVPSL